MNKRIIYGLGCLLAALASCSESDDLPADTNRGPLTLWASIAGSGGTATRATSTLPDGSYTSFGKDDQVGFYSQKGNVATGGGFANERMDYGTKANYESDHDYHSFFSKDMNVDYNNIKPMTAYYPYYDKMEDSSDPGMLIRGDNGSMKDILFGFSQDLKVGSYSISGAFNHIGARIIITLGEGFSTDNNTTITLRMNKPFKYMKIVDGDEPARYYKVPKFIEETNNPTEEDYTFTAQKYRTDEVEKYYVILPTCCNHMEREDEIEAYVYSITLKDIYGAERTIKTENWVLPDGHRLDIGHELWRGNNYKVTISMEGLEPTIYPHDIYPWGEEDVTSEAGTGIHDIKELADWIKTYNSPDSENRTEALKKYGSLGGTESNQKWSFYLTGDIDCSNILEHLQADKEVSSFINEFKDNLDGRGYTLKNISLKSTSETGAGLFGTLSGTVTNLHVENITVVDENSKSVGSLAATISGGTVSNCTVRNLNIIGKSYAGALAGEMTGETAKAEGCTFTGTVAGKRNEGNTSKLVGNHTAGTLKSDNNAVNVIYVEVK